MSASFNIRILTKDENSVTDDPRHYYRNDGTNYIGAFEYGGLATLIPALGEWGIAALLILMLVFGGWFVYRKFS